MDVCIILGSKSDLPIAEKCVSVLNEFSISHEVRVASAHRAPKYLESVVESSIESGCRIFIGMAGMAAALPGVIASMTTLPVIGVPVKSSNSIDGWDSILSILQMPGGVPVATVALNGAKNAGILAAQIIGASDKCVLDKVLLYKEGLKTKVLEASKKIKS